MKIITLISVTLVLLLTGVRQSQAFLTASGVNIVDSSGSAVLLRGYGLGGWLVPEGYMLHVPGYGSPTSIHDRILNLIGSQNTAQFYQQYEANYVNGRDIRQIAEWGFNSIRLPFHFKVFYDTSAQAFRPEGFALLDSVIAWCKTNNLYLILDMHCAPGGQNKDNISDSDGVEARLWTESQNRDLTILIWKEIAARYANEPVIGGYDLLNEPVLPEGYSNSVLRDFYVQLTNAIRQVDTNHLVFIEGNWYATDFNQLTPPWDNNMAYSFHKYWNATDVGSIQGYLGLRNQHNVPLWLGESGENSNAWYYETIRLMEQNNVGWCWWAHKKLETTTSPLSARINIGYQMILNYWNGQAGQPSQSAATAALLEMADNLKIENCTLRPGVIRSLTDQNYGVIAQPFNTHVLPGEIDAADYDFGTNGIGYTDTDYRNTGGPGGASWNNGGKYRNDGVDIEDCQDIFGSQYDVGWIENGERLMYTVNVQTSGLYRLTARIASLNGGGRFLLIADQQPVSGTISVPSTGGWQDWSTVQADSLFLPNGVHQLVMFILQGGFNLNRLTFDLIVAGVEEDKSESPLRYEIEQNFPNPFNPSTTFRYSIPKKGRVDLTIYNSLGQAVKTLVSALQPAGVYQVEWNARDFASGIYYYRLRSGDFSGTKRLILTE